ncbi:hypothetical protein FACS1894217_00480 [Clostridia bacterium]|nr:hypothetical protein FACS1894217_00480 [Clostridia bacterium]
MAAYEAALRLFSDNTRTIKKAFKWQNILAVRLASMLLTASNVSAREEKLLEIKLMLKSSVGVFSNLRGNVELPLIAILAQAGRPQETLQSTIHVQTLLKAEKFWKNDYLGIAAAQIALRVPHENHAGVVKRSREFYDAMRRNHPLITGTEDYSSCCMLAIAGLGVQPTTVKIEELMAELKPHFGGAPNVRQTLAQLLVLGEADPSGTVDRILALREELRSRRLKPGVEIAAVLGVLSLMPGEPRYLAEQVADCYHDLKADSAFGKWQAKNVTLLFAASLVTVGVVTELTNATLTNTITNLILAQQAAIATGNAAIVAAVASN